MPKQAGEGEDGRMKSAIGIGALLMDGLGDTIRVSLTEDPELEIVPCRYSPMHPVLWCAGMPRNNQQASSALCAQMPLFVALCLLTPACPWVAGSWRALASAPAERALALSPSQR